MPSQTKEAIRMSSNIPTRLETSTLVSSDLNTLHCQLGPRSTIIDRSGLDTSKRPIEWSSLKKWKNILLISTLTLLTTFDSSMFAPAIDQVMREFGSTNNTIASFVVSVYLLGYACGPLFLAPMSELYGRRPVYQITTIIFLIFNVACALSTSLSMLVTMRFLTGVAGSCPLTIGSGTIADCFSSKDRGRVISIWMLPVMLGPALGPLTGGYISHYLGWRWNFWISAIMVSHIAKSDFNLILLVPTLFLLDETYSAILVQKREKRIGKEELKQKKAVTVFANAILRPAKLLLFSPIVFFLAFYLGVIYGCLYLTFITMPDIFESQYGMSSSVVGLTYLGSGTGAILGLLLIGFVSDKVAVRMAKDGDIKPEYRLPPVLFTGLLLPLGLLWFGWAAEKQIHFMVAVAGTMFIRGGMIVVSIPISAYIIDAFTTYAASAMAANVVLRSIGGALLPLCANQLLQKLGIGWGYTLLGLVVLGMLPMIFCLIRYGEQLREHAKFQL